MTKVGIEYDYSGVDRVMQIPTTGQLIVFQKQMAKVLESYKCNIAEAQDNGWSQIMCTIAQQLLKRGITAQVLIPADPGPYTGNTNSLHAAYKQKPKLYEEYEEHKRNTNKALKACFHEDLFVKLKIDGLLLGIIPIDAYQHLWTSFLLKMDKDQEILKVKEPLKVYYNPDWIVQYYYKDINEAKQLQTALRETVTDEEVIWNAYVTFEKHINLKEACQDWNQRMQTSWEDIRKHFSKEIQMNKTDPAIMKRTEVDDVVLTQTEEEETTKRQTLGIAVLQA